MSGLNKVLEIAGGATNIARQVSTPDRECSRQVVEYWIRRGYVPISWARRVSNVFGVPLEELNPAVYGSDEAAA